MLAAVLGLMMVAGFNPAVLTIPVFEAAPDYSTTTLKAYAKSVAIEHELNVRRFIQTIECESHFQWDAIGDSGTSLGIAQFRFPEKNWRISSSTAMDPYAAIDRMADAWKEGLQARWSCY